MANTAKVKTDLVFFCKETNESRVVPAGTEVWIDKAWKSGALRLRIKGNLHTRQLSKEYVARLVEVGA